jgi:hypothetical protein
MNASRARAAQGGSCRTRPGATKSRSCGGGRLRSITTYSSAAATRCSRTTICGSARSSRIPHRLRGIVEQRLDETEIGRAKFVTLTEIQRQSGVTAAALPDWLLLDRQQADLIDYDVFASIYNKGKFALLGSWRDRLAAERFNPLSRTGVSGARHRIVRVVRDYGMFDRRESPQYYPAAGAGSSSDA